MSPGRAERHGFEYFRHGALSLYAALDVHTGKVLGKTARHTKKVAAFLEQHPRVRLHFTPTYSSWLNQVEIWLARIERDVIARGIFLSVSDLSRKLMRSIR
jgi:transposase